jgi:hypothetical protein
MTTPPPSDSDMAGGIAKASVDVGPYVKDSIIASILGGLAMTARILLSPDPVTFGFVLRRFLAASITAAIVGLATKDHFTSTGLWLACVGGAGYAAPEVADYFLRYVKAKGEQKLKEVTSAKKKTKSKSKRR